MKKVLCVVGIGLVVGVAVYLLLNNKKECDVCTYYKERENQKDAKKNTESNSIEIVHDEPVYYDVKSSAFENIHERHKTAASFMKETVETICNNVKTSEDTNNKIEEISAELDKMLREN